MSDPSSPDWDHNSASDGVVGSGVDDFGLPASSDTHPFTLPEAERYRPDGTLGVGGMGVVDVVWDRRLQRQVARKRSRPGSGSRPDRRLAQEAWITAQLDHPGIIAIHDAGEGPDGALAYTMPLVRGQTLEAALSGPPPHLAWLRHLRDACEAVGYAHQQGFVHRDLKPANIMVGAFGETRVMDWGLARPVPGPEGDRWRALMPDHLRAHTRDGAVLGTPLYMSPEQAAGEPVGPQSDVWSLGVILYELLCGASPFAADSERRVLAAILTGSRPPVHERSPQVAGPLVAITDRALALDPSQRYPHAKALADDLTRWLEGRRVDAHDYTAVERAGRLVTRLKVPLIVGAVALVIGLVATATFARRAHLEATDAAAARTRAEDATARAEAHLQQALVSQALAALADHDRGTAEVLAARALTISEDPDARGILASWPDTPRPSVRSEVDAPACDHAHLDPTGRWLACTSADTLALWTVHPLERRWEHKVGTASSVSVTTDGRSAVQLDDSTRIYSPTGALERTVAAVVRPRLGPDTTTVWSANQVISAVGHPAAESFPALSPDHPTVRQIEACGRVLTLEADRWAAACVGRLVVHTASGRSQHPLPPLQDIGDPTALQLIDNDVVVGTVESHLLRLDRTTDTIAWRLTVDQGAVVSIARTADSSRLAVLLERGGVLLVDARTGQLLSRLPPVSRARAIRIDDHDVLTTFGATIRRTQLPPSTPPTTRTVPGGVNDLEVHPDGSELVAAYGGGFVRWSWPEGAVRATTKATCVVRDVDWTADGRLVVGMALPDCVDGVEGSIVVDTSPRTTPIQTVFGVRRLGTLGANTVALTSYGPSGPSAVSLSAHHVPPTLTQPDGVPVSIENTLDAGMLVWSGTRGVWRFQLGDTSATRIWDHNAAGPIAVEPHGAFVVVATDSALHRLDPTTGAIAWTTPTPEVSPRDAAVSPDGRWVAVGARDGTARVYGAAEGTLHAVVRGHTEQVAAVAFGPDSRHLITGSWDDTVRLWDITVLDAHPTVLHEQVTAAWRLDLASSLRAR